MAAQGIGPRSAPGHTDGRGSLQRGGMSQNKSGREMARYLGLTGTVETGRVKKTVPGEGKNVWTAGNDGQFRETGHRARRTWSDMSQDEDG